MKNIAKATLAIICIMLSVFLVKIGVEKSERAECKQWQKEASQFPAYYLTEWQAEQCDHYNIEVAAPVNRQRKNKLYIRNYKIMINLITTDLRELAEFNRLYIARFNTDYNWQSFLNEFDTIREAIEALTISLSVQRADISQKKLSRLITHYKSKKKAERSQNQ